jgi:hypothetical protein
VLHFQGKFGFGQALKRSHLNIYLANSSYIIQSGFRWDPVRLVSVTQGTHINISIRPGAIQDIHIKYIPPERARIRRGWKGTYPI